MPSPAGDAQSRTHAEGSRDYAACAPKSLLCSWPRASLQQAMQIAAMPVAAAGREHTEHRSSVHRNPESFAGSTPHTAGPSPPRANILLLKLLKRHLLHQLHPRDLISNNRDLSSGGV